MGLSMTINGIKYKTACAKSTLQSARGFARMAKKGFVIFTLLFGISTSLAQSSYTPRKLQLPLKLSANESVDLKQRRGDSVRIRAVRTIKIATGQGHQSQSNIVAVYIGLPLLDSAQDNIVIESVKSQKADPAKMLLSLAEDSLLVEYCDIKPGFSDEISMTFTVDIYERRAELRAGKAYDLTSSLYQKYTKSNVANEDMPPEESLDSKPDISLKKTGIQMNYNPVVKAKKIYDYLAEKLSYGGVSDLSGDQRVHCGVYAALFVDLCRQAGVPARRCAGFAFGVNPQDPNKTDVSGHNWAEFYVEDVGWIPVDPTMGDKKDPRKTYYFGSVDNGRLCVSKSGFHGQLPLWYKTSANGDLIFTENATDFKPFKSPDTIQGAHRFQYRFDRPIQISISDSYGSGLQILSRSGNFVKPQR